MYTNRAMQKLALLFSNGLPKYWDQNVDVPGLKLAYKVLTSECGRPNWAPLCQGAPASQVAVKFFQIGICARTEIDLCYQTKRKTPRPAWKLTASCLDPNKFEWCWYQIKLNPARNRTLNFTACGIIKIYHKCRYNHWNI